MTRFLWLLQGSSRPQPVPESVATPPAEANRNSICGDNFPVGARQGIVPLSNGTTDYGGAMSSLPSSIAPPKSGVPYVDKHELRYGAGYTDAEEATFMTSTHPFTLGVQHVRFENVAPTLLR